MSDRLDDDKTPILLHPAKRTELLKQGCELFNEEEFFEAHEVWEELWLVEHGRDRVFVQGLIQVAAHFVHLRKGNWSGAGATGSNACDKLKIPAAHRLYRELDITPLTSALHYNLGLLVNRSEGTPPPPPDSFIVPKLFEH
ncbi:MAG: DUF309 domain-containing protein [Deltaproteobacteria bacterium]|nr:DUF309 domain-containing protein [Deltaproteobacteria bacterium]